VFDKEGEVLVVELGRPAWSTLGRPHAVALRFARRDQLATGLAPVGVRPCWAHKGKTPPPCEGWGYVLTVLDQLSSSELDR
jgi:hypothetical protein